MCHGRVGLGSPCSIRCNGGASTARSPTTRGCSPSAASRALRTRPSSPAFDVAIVGAPMDELVSDRPGTRFGPRAIRTASCPPGPHLEAGVDAFAELRIVDFGDAAVVPAQPQRSHAAIEADRARDRRRRGDAADHRRRPFDHRAERARRRRAPRAARPGALRHPHRHRRAGCSGRACPTGRRCGQSWTRA